MTLRFEMTYMSDRIWASKEPVLVKYRSRAEIDAIIRMALAETGLVQRVEIDHSLGLNVRAYSNKRSGGWRVDMSFYSYQFTVDDTLDQMKSYVTQEFMKTIRNTIDEWLERSRHDSINKVMTAIVTDLKAERDDNAIN
jgi:hypothetical protein